MTRDVPAAGRRRRGPRRRRPPRRPARRRRRRASGGVLLTTADGRAGTVDAAHVIVCGGAIQTPALLQRSGLRRHIGRTLAVHPTVKLAARFADEVNVADDVPVHQVKEFAPDLSFGGSASGPGLVALALSDQWAAFGAATSRTGGGSPCTTRRSPARDAARCAAIPGLRDPLVTYRLTRRDRDAAAQRAGPPRPADARGRRDRGATRRSAARPSCATRRDLATMAATFGVARASVMTVHLCSTVPLGEDAGVGDRLLRAACAAPPTSRSTTPRCCPTRPASTRRRSVMAFAIRNARRFVETTKRAR